MLLSFITPTAHIKDFGAQSDFILALSHLCDPMCENEYATSILKTGLLIYLDNGTFEVGKPESQDSLLRKAELLGAKYVFAPDYLYDAATTWGALQAFIELRDHIGVDVKIAAIPQAKDSRQYLELYRDFAKNKDVELIGLSILTIPHAFEHLTGTKDVAINRLLAISMIDDGPTKDSHLLGLGDSFDDLIYATSIDWIKSNDSSSAFLCGYEGKRYEGAEIPGGKPKAKLDFESKGLTKKQRTDIQFNIDTLRKLANDSQS